MSDIFLPVWIEELTAPSLCSRRVSRGKIWQIFTRMLTFAMIDMIDDGTSILSAQHHSPMTASNRTTHAYCSKNPKSTQVKTVQKTLWDVFELQWYWNENWSFWISWLPMTIKLREEFRISKERHNKDVLSGRSNDGMPQKNPSMNILPGDKS